MKTLVAFTTRHGTTRRYADLIARSLPGEVVLADLRKAGRIDLSGFETVVLGTPIYYGQAPQEFKEFCQRHLEALKGRRLGLFICCWFVNQAQQELQAAFPAGLLEEAAAKAALGGVLDLNRLSLLERMMAKLVAGPKGSASRYSEEAARRFVLNLATASRRTTP